MKLVFSFWLTFALMLPPRSSLAADQIDRAAITYQGTSGFFFSKTIADRMLVDLTNYPLVVNELELYKKKSSLFTEQLSIKTQQVQLEEAVAKKWQMSFDLEHKLRLEDAKYYNEQISKKDKWYTSWPFWFVVGVVVGAGVSIGTAFGIQEAKN